MVVYVFTTNPIEVHLLYIEVGMYICEMLEYLEHGIGILPRPRSP